MKQQVPDSYRTCREKLMKMTLGEIREEREWVCKSLKEQRGRVKAAEAALEEVEKECCEFTLYEAELTNAERFKEHEQEEL